MRPMTDQFKVGDAVLVPWGLGGPMRATVVEVWGDAAEHLRVQLHFEDAAEEDDPSVILISREDVLSAA